MGCGLRAAGCTLRFETMKDEMVQVLHSWGNHWLLVVTIGCTPGTVKVYNSLSNALPFQTALLATVLRA